MKLRVRLADSTEGHLTTEHAASSYGQPVLVVGGLVYGPQDYQGDLQAIDILSAEDAEAIKIAGWKVRST